LPFYSPVRLSLRPSFPTRRSSDLNPNYKHYAYTIRPYLHMVMFESYFTDSSNSGQITPSFPDNKYNWAPKLNAEAGRPDGFNVVDRKSTRLNSSHVSISYAVFCLK